MIKRADIILKGRVQKAGFRDYIDEVAYNLDIKGWVKNLEDNTVKIVCEGKKEAVRKSFPRRIILMNLKLTLSPRPHNHF